MSYKHFLSFLLVLFFSSLVACGSSDSESSGDKKEDNSDSQQNSQENNESTKACVKGDNPLKEGETCKTSKNIYICRNGGVQTIDGSIKSGQSISINKEYTFYCASNPPN